MSEKDELFYNFDSDSQMNLFRKIAVLFQAFWKVHQNSLLQDVGPSKFNFIKTRLRHE